jgi:predicted  nucleic acid-binding Zn-ribbon protein
MEQNKEQPQNNSNRLAAMLLGLLLLVSIGFNIYQWRHEASTVVTYDNQIDTMVTVRIELERELATSQLELDKYRGMSTALDSLLNDANEKIAGQEKKIRDVLAKEKNSASLNKKLKKELEELRKLKDEYFEKIDQLVLENKELKEQNEILQESIGGLKTEKTVLQGKVNMASQLKAEYLKVASFKKRGNGKYVESALAKRTNKLELCFTVLDNQVAEKGERIVYCVIKEPSGKVLAGYSKATFNDAATGAEQVATASQKMDYDGGKQNLCLNYENDERILSSGTYTFSIYIDGTLVAETAYMLK